MYEASTPRACAAVVASLLLAPLSAQDPAAKTDATHDHRSAAALPEPLPLSISFAIQAAAGASSEPDSVLESLHGGGHDPRKRGFTFQNAELGISGDVDRHFELHAYLIAFLDPYDGETVVELEEAFAETRELPAGLELRAGSYFTEFGRINALHPHDRDWQNQPIVNTRLFGPDGMRGPGARVRWSPPALPGFSAITGVHGASGEAMHGFLANDEVYEERPLGGRAFTDRRVRSLGDLVWTGRVAHDFELGCADAGIGASLAFGPNATGASADTIVYGIDFVSEWPREHDGHREPGFVLQGEFLVRRFDAADQVDENDVANPADDVAVPGQVLDDWGGYLHGIVGLGHAWSIGVRGEWASGSGASYFADSDGFSRRLDPFRGDRWRVSPLLTWRPSEAARVRLQYDWDDTDHLGGSAHSVWLGVDVRLGAHPAHAH